ncbi:membrane protein insertase YidC [Massilia sp. ST3]|uniref:membrane protein insertase YidC n=1 Tax=Massilia sp. ST3 TaxID=2824903 RepID=UPI001B82D968|nr:membrane protein insertase YidC [Massilia sp. ST3]MBQ5946183.1 membrane protein insertase YidC [Massilia sp. ST3]
MNEFLGAAMSSLAQLFGGSMGWAILALALVVRLALLPLTLRLARRMLANQQKMKELQPQVDAIKQRLAADPKAMFAAISALYREHGVSLFDRSALVGALVQWPVFALVLKAVGNAGTGAFLWIRNLATPDTALTMLVLLLTAVAAWAMPSASGTPILMLVVQVVAMALVIWKLGAGMGLYWAASAFVNLVQGGVLRIEQRRRRMPAKA